jgi:hypothetical protein
MLGRRTTDWIVFQKNSCHAKYCSHELVHYLLDQIFSFEMKLICPSTWPITSVVVK